MNEENLVKLMGFAAGVMTTLVIWGIASLFGWRPTL